MERRALRRDRHPAVGRAGAIRRAARGLILAVVLAATPAFAQAPDASRDDLSSSGVPDAPSWWAEPGRPGFAPDVASGAMYPWVLAGHVRGAWDVDEPDLAEMGPYPSILGVGNPLAWMDSLEVRDEGGESGWDGFHGALAKVHLRRRLPPAQRARLRSSGELVLGSGSNALDGNGLSVARADSVSWWRAGTLSWKRGGLGELGPAGRHHYGFAGGWTRGRHVVEARLTQAGSAAELIQGESQSAAGAGGTLRYALSLRRSIVGLELGRGYDHHESFDGLLTDSRRDAHQRHGTLTWSGRDDAWSGRVEARDEWVTRVTADQGTRAWTATSLWLAARLRGRLGPARLESSMGVGRHDAAGGSSWAPSVRLELGERAWTTTLHAERVLAPVWSDLDTSVTAFLQSTWKGGAELAWRDERRRVSASWIMGRTEDRALAARLPFEELWLREGFRRDPDPFDFGLATASAEWRGRAWAARAEGYSLFRDGDAPQATIDPRRGGRFSLETGFRAFMGDLGVRLRGEAAAVSGRGSTLPAGGWVEGYWTYGLTAVVSLADAIVTLRVRNLEDEVRALPWVVPETGAEAAGEGLEFRMGLSWRLYN